MSSKNEFVSRSDLKISNFEMPFAELHLDVYQLIFEYLSQDDLLNLLLMNHTFYQQVMKYIDAVNLIQIIDGCNYLHQCCNLNMIISIKMCILKSSDMHWNCGLCSACGSGNETIAKMMIKKGANNFNGGLYRACKGGHKMLAKFMIEKGAEYCNYCSKPMKEHYKK